MKVYIAQLLCPERHCILGAYGEYESLEDAKELGEKLRAAAQCAVAEKLMNPWCGICRSRDWHVEVGATRFATREVAKAFMDECERQQAMTARFLKGSRS